MRYYVPYMSASVNNGSYDEEISSVFSVNAGEYTLNAVFANNNEPARSQVFNAKGNSGIKRAWSQI